MEQEITRRTAGLAVAAVASCIGISALAQIPVDDSGYAVESLGPVDPEFTAPEDTFAGDPAGDVVFGEAELQDLVGPIALYPDDLIAIVLPASTYPLQIVQAARFLEAYENDSTLEPEEDWDESVVALLNYPDVLRKMDADIDWTWQLGQAVIDQQQDVIAAVEGFRNRAYAAGNLKTDDYQEVRYEDDIIEIVPIEDDVIYVPYYEPEEVVVYQPVPVYHYYPVPRPVYYYPYPVGHAFSAGYFWGVTTAFHIGWSTNYLRVYHPTYWGHPYYGRSYYGHYYRRPSVNIYHTTYINRSTVNRYRDGDYWAPRRRAGARPSDYYSRTRSHGRLRAERHERNDVRASRHTSYQTGDRRESGARDNRGSVRNRPMSSDRASARDRNVRDRNQRAPRPASRQATDVSADRPQPRAARRDDGTARNRAARRSETTATARATQRSDRVAGSRPARRSEPASTARPARRSEPASTARPARRSEPASTDRPRQRSGRAATVQSSRRTEPATRARPVQRSARAESAPARAPRASVQRPRQQRAAPTVSTKRQARPARQQVERAERKAAASDRGERRREGRKPRRSER